MSSSAVKEKTPYLGLNLLNFAFPNWGDDANANMTIIDAALANFGFSFSGEWKNATTYIVGTIVLDAVTNELYRALVEHVSRASGTFAQDRSDHPSYWAPYSIVVTGRGQWVTNTQYYPNDVVFDEYVWAIANKQFISGASLAADITAQRFVVIFDGTAVVAATQASADAAAGSEEAAEGSADAAAASATAAGTSQTAAASSATAAATSATNAANSATASDASATASENSAVSSAAAAADSVAHAAAAATSETNAATSEANAEDDADRAELAATTVWSLNNFFTSEALGLSGTSIGENFAIPGTDPYEIEIYLHDTGDVAVFLSGYPSVQMLIDAAADFPTIVDRLDFMSAEQFEDYPKVRGSTMWWEDTAGNRVGINDITFDTSTRVITMEGMIIDFEDTEDSGTEEKNWLEDSAGNRRFITPLDFGDDGGTASTGDAPYLFDWETYAEWDNYGLIESIRLGSQDMSLIPEYIDGNNLIGWEGQSFAGQDGVAGRFLTEARILQLGLDFSNFFQIGDDERCASSGATFDIIGSATIQQLRERVISPEPATAYSELRSELGRYPSNARTGALGPIAAYVFNYLNQIYWDETGFRPAKKIFSMNKAKNEGRLSEILQGNGLLRYKDMITKFNTFASGPKQVLFTGMLHGQHDEAFADDDYNYDTAYQAARDDIWTFIQATLGQTLRPPWLQSQVAGPRYGNSAMVCAQHQLDEMLDVTGGNKDVFLVASDSEIASLWDLDYVKGSATGHPEANNAHQEYASRILQGIRWGIAAHYIFVRREPYFLPHFHKFGYVGDTALLVAPNMVGALDESPMPATSVLQMPIHRGLKFTHNGGTENPVLFVRRVPGTRYLIEAKLLNTWGTDPQLIAGPNNTTFSGSNLLTLGDQTAQVYFRDKFTIKQPFTPDWLDRRRRFHNPSYNPSLPDASDGYYETLALTGLGRFADAITGYFDQPFNLGNPFARGIINGEVLS